jgi:hypothetical protein
MLRYYYIFFEDMAGLKINFDKSEIMMVMEDSIKLETYAMVHQFVDQELE